MDSLRRRLRRRLSDSNISRDLFHWSTVPLLKLSLALLKSFLSLIHGRNFGFDRLDARLDVRQSGRKTSQSIPFPQSACHRQYTKTGRPSTSRPAFDEEDFGELEKTKAKWRGYFAAGVGKDTVIGTRNHLLDEGQKLIGKEVRWVKPSDRNHAKKSRFDLQCFGIEIS